MSGPYDYAYRKARERVLRGSTVCHICGEALDWDADPRSRMAPSADHTVPIRSLRGMDPRAARRIAADSTLLRPCHVGCATPRAARTAANRNTFQGSGEMLFDISMASRYLRRRRRRDEATALRKIGATTADLRVWRRDPKFLEAERAAIGAPRGRPQLIALGDVVTRPRGRRTAPRAYRAAGVPAGRLWVHRPWEGWLMEILTDVDLELVAISCRARPWWSCSCGCVTSRHGTRTKRPRSRSSLLPVGRFLDGRNPVQLQRKLAPMIRGLLRNGEQV